MSSDSRKEVEAQASSQALDGDPIRNALRMGSPDACASTSFFSLHLAVAAGCVAASFVIIFYHFLATQGRFAFRHPSDWGHTLVIPFMAGYLAYLKRSELERIGFRTTWIALFPIVLGVAWYVFCWTGPQGIRHHNLMGAGFGLTLFGVVLLFAGWGAMRHLFFPIAYLLVFGVTISDRFWHLLTYKLQDIAAFGASIMLKVMGFTVDLKGNTIVLLQGAVEHPLNIAEACSGMRMLVAFLALGVFMAFTSLERGWQRTILILLAVPVALFVNVLRVVTLGLLSLVDSDLAAGDFHSFIGLLWLVPALILYLGIIWVLKRLVIEDGAAHAVPIAARTPEVAEQERRDAVRSPSPVALGDTARREARRTGARHLLDLDSQAKLAAIVCCATLLVSGLGFIAAVQTLNIYLVKKSIPLRRPLDKIPRELGAWTRGGEDLILDEAQEKELGTRDYLTRLYERNEGDPSRKGRRGDRLATPGADRLHLHVTYYTDQVDAVPHVPERCFLAGGWSPVGTAQHIPIKLDRSAWFVDDGPVNRRTGKPYWFVRAIDPWTRRPYVVRMPIPTDGETIELRVFEFRDTQSPDDRLVAGYFFITNGCATSVREKIRALAFDRTDEYAYYAKLEFAIGTRGEHAVERFVENVTDLLQPLLPEVMRCLPDWSEVENRTVAAPMAATAEE